MIGGVVLLVEDNPVVQIDLELTLKEFGASDVLVASTVEAALASLADLSFALLISERYVDRKSCAPIFELARRQGLLYIVATAFGGAEPTETVSDSRPVLVKPYTIDRLQSAIRFVLNI